MDKAKSDITAGSSDISLEEGLLEHNARYFEGVVREVFASKRDYFIHALAQRLRAVGVSTAGEIEQAQEGEGEWIGIESLSRLRSVVGGRFQNLKKKWVAAGFPLRDHRGDKNKQYSVDEEGWVELSNWILKQKYEARLTSDKTEYLFELRECLKE